MARNKALRYSIITTFAAGIALMAGTFLRPSDLEVNREYTNRRFTQGRYQGHIAYAGFSFDGRKVAKIYGDIKQDSKGREFMDSVHAADMNRDGIFQENELIDIRSVDMGNFILGGSPTEQFGGTIARFANPQALEEVFAKIKPVQNP